jgi:lipoprotein-releasing system ATP-binding protein
MEQEAEDVPVVYLHEIKRQYTQGTETLTILNGAKLALWAGQSVALVAPSGAGKSTLLHIAGLLETPDDGEVYIGGAPTSQLSDIERTLIRRTDIGFVYQSHRLLPEFSALENVMLPQMIRGLKRAETVKRATEILAYLGLGDRIKPGRRNCRAASNSGWRSRARSPMRRASSWPTSRPATSTPYRRPRVRSDDAAGQATRVAMLIVTHNMELASRMDRRVSLEEGRVVELD